MGHDVRGARGMGSGRRAQRTCSGQRLGALHSQCYGQGNAALVAAAEGPGTQTALPGTRPTAERARFPSSALWAARTPHPPT